MAAQYKVPFLLIVLNNAYLGLIRQASRAYEMDYEVGLGFEVSEIRRELGGGVVVC